MAAGASKTSLLLQLVLCTLLIYANVTAATQLPKGCTPTAELIKTSTDPLCHLTSFPDCAAVKLWWSNCSGQCVLMGVGPKVTIPGFLVDLAAHSNSRSTQFCCAPLSPSQTPPTNLHAMQHNLFMLSQYSSFLPRAQPIYPHNLHTLFEASSNVVVIATFVVMLSRCPLLLLVHPTPSLLHTHNLLNRLGVIRVYTVAIL